MEPFYKEGHYVSGLQSGVPKEYSRKWGEVVALWNQVYSEDGEGSVLIRRIAPGGGSIETVTMCFIEMESRIRRI